jgi:hypothetical protein
VSKRAKDVIGTKEFRKLFNQISENEPQKRELHNAFKTLQEDCLCGNKITHDLWPQSYIKKYKIKNLWRLPLRSGWRLVYTIMGEKDGFVVCIIEAFSHKEYEKRFGY